MEQDGWSVAAAVHEWRALGGGKVEVVREYLGETADGGESATASAAASAAATAGTSDDASFAAALAAWRAANVALRSFFFLWCFVVLLHELRKPPTVPLLLLDRSPSATSDTALSKFLLLSAALSLGALVPEVDLVFASRRSATVALPIISTIKSNKNFTPHPLK